MRVIAGLGNPGSKYEQTRHNLGARLLDRVYEASSCASGTPKWKEQGPVKVAEAVFADSKVLLVRSLRYMNVSGPGIAELLRYYKIDAQDLLAIYDDLDLPFGALRIRSGGGDGGHNGVASLIEALGSAEFMRLKLGIGRPPAELAARIEISDWVIGAFEEQELPLVEQMLQRGLLAVEELIRFGVKTAQNKFN